MAKRPNARESSGLRELVERIRRANPTGRRCSAAEGRARYAEKARLQSLLIEAHPDEVRVRSHDDMPGVVSLSVPRLEASAAHAALDALSLRARAWIEGQLEAEAAEAATFRPGGRAPSPPEGEGPLSRASRFLAEYDFECAEAELEAALREGAPAERRRALVMLLELYVDRLANDQAALSLEPALRPLEPLPERAHELLGVAAHRAGELEAALGHLGRCGGERAAEVLAAIAESAADARAWGFARRAWAQLMALTAPGEGAPPPRLRGLCEAVRGRLGARAAGACERELEADAALVRFVKEFAPGHPWLDEQRAEERAARARASASALLERAEALAAEGDFEGVERALGAFSGLDLPSPPAVAARVEGLLAWAKGRRDEALSERALAAASAGSLEAACRVFLGLPERAKAKALAGDASHLFAALETLAAAAPGRPTERALSAAAAAWAEARSVDGAAERLRLLAPHAGLLEAVSAFADELRSLRESEPERPHAAPPSPPPPPPSGPREVWSGGLCLRELGEAEAGASETLGVAARALRVGDASFVVTLERPSGLDGAYDVALRPTAGRSPLRRVRLEGPSGFRPSEIFVMGPRVVVAAGGLVAWAIDVVPGLGATHIELRAPDGDFGRGALAVVDERTFALESSAGARPRWALADAATGAVRAEMRGPRLCRASGAKGATFYRVAGRGVERLDAKGEAVDRLELPEGLSPSAVVESPLGPSPIVLAPSAEGPDLTLWWRAQEQLFRSFALFNTAEHGALVEAVCFADRGVCVASRRADGAAFLHTVWAERGILRPRRSAQKGAGHLGLVVDPSGRRGWWAQRDGQGGLGLEPINLRPDDA